MAARFRSTDAIIRWCGVDDSTPPGYCIAVGTDSLGTHWIWLFKGDRPTDDSFAGSISIPSRAGQTPVVYGPGGGFFGTANDTGEALARLSERFES